MHIHKYKNKLVVVKELIRPVFGNRYSRMLGGSPSVKEMKKVCACKKLKNGGYAGREDYEIPV